MKLLPDTHRRKLFHALDVLVDRIESLDSRDLCLCLLLSYTEINKSLELIAIFPVRSTSFVVIYLLGIVQGIMYRDCYRDSRTREEDDTQEEDNRK